MKFIAIVMLLGFCSVLIAQDKNNLLSSLIATEYAFAKSAADIGTRDAFLSYIADDGILFRPNPVNGKDYLLNSGSSSGSLRWYPIFSSISKTGDLGFTTGPWEFTSKEKDSTKTLYGNYCTVWESKTDGDWEFVIDFGTQNEKPNQQLPRLSSSLNYSAKPLKNLENKKDDPLELFELDKQIKSDTYIKYLGADSRFLRDGIQPIIGSNNISEYLSGNKMFCCFTPIGGKFSLSKDFGFTYGTYESSDPKIKDQFNYVHIWMKEGNQWILLVDVTKKKGK